MVSFVQSRSPCAQATLVETHKQQALYSYKKYKAYQPLTTYWAEAELIVKGGGILGHGVSTLSDYVRLSVKGKCPLSRLPC